MTSGFSTRARRRRGGSGEAMACLSRSQIRGAGRPPKNGPSRWSWPKVALCRAELIHVNPTCCLSSWGGAATALLAGAGFATTASADVATMTCGEFKAMDDAGRMGAAHELMHRIADAANFEASAPLKRYFEDSPEKAELMDDRLSDPTGSCRWGAGG